MKLLAVAVGLLVGVLIAEVALRIVGYTFPTLYTTDDSRGFALRAGIEGRYRKEGGAYVRVNSAGLRDREHAIGKPPGVLRIAILGDSYAEALQVEQEEAFWAVMERRLNECASLNGRTVEVINFGVSGYGTAQELITLRERAWQYSPDVVLLAFTTNNDITDNSRALKRTDEVPYFFFREGRLALDDSFRSASSFRWRTSAPNRLGVWLRDSSRVLQAFHEGHYALKGYLAKRRAEKEQAARRTEAAPPATETATNETAAPRTEDVGTDNLVYRAPINSEWEEAWRVTEALLILMRDEVEQRGARFVVVTLSNGIQVYPDAEARRAFMSRVGATDIFYPDLRIKTLGERERIAVINLAPELQAHADQHKTFLHGFGENIGNGHWNAEGHRTAGELLTEKLCAELSR